MPETVREVTQLRGLNLRQESGDVQDPEQRFLNNLDPFREPGALAIRKGSTTLGGPLSGVFVRAIARINQTRYQVAGRRFYRDFTLIQSELAKNEETQLVSFRPLNDSVTWAFLADDDWMFKDHAQTQRYFLWGIEEPLLPGPKVANQTGKIPGDTITAGTYKIAVTQLRWDELVEL